MPRLTLIIPDLLDPDGESILTSLPPTLARMAGEGTITRSVRLPPTETPEAQYLGMPPSEGQMRQGPLTVAALGADPPTGSTHFHLSLMAHSDAVASEIGLDIPPDQERAVLGQFERLNTKSLTIVKGSGVDHGLVWEGRGDMRTVPARDVDGKPIRDHLPEGDGETILRRLIDDSVNLLSELELNEQRVDRGLPPLNLLWPWGDGLRFPVPNLALRNGEPAYVWSRSLRLRGLTRLAGYISLPQPRGTGINLDLGDLASATRSREPLVAVIEIVSSLRQEGRLEEAAWLLREVDDKVLKPLTELGDGTPVEVSLISPTAGAKGLALAWQSRKPVDNLWPFDERSLEERFVPELDLHQIVKRALQPKPAAPLS